MTVGTAENNAQIPHPLPGFQRLKGAGAVIIGPQPQGGGVQGNLRPHDLIKFPVGAILAVVGQLNDVALQLLRGVEFHQFFSGLYINVCQKQNVPVGIVNPQHRAGVIDVVIVYIILAIVEHIDGQTSAGQHIAPPQWGRFDAVLLQTLQESRCRPIAVAVFHGFQPFQRREADAHIADLEIKPVIIPQNAGQGTKMVVMGVGDEPQVHPAPFF